MRQKTHDQPRIVFVAGLILVLATIFSGSIVFLLMERHAEGLLRKNLLSSLQNKVKTVESEIRQRRAAAVTVATRPFLIDQVQRASAPGGGDEALRMLERGARSFLSSGLSAIALYGTDGHELAHAGAFAQRPRPGCAARSGGAYANPVEGGFPVALGRGYRERGTPHRQGDCGGALARDKQPVPGLQPGQDQRPGLVRAPGYRHAVLSHHPQSRGYTPPVTAEAGQSLAHELRPAGADRFHRHP